MCPCSWCSKLNGYHAHLPNEDGKVECFLSSKPCPLRYHDKLDQDAFLNEMPKLETWIQERECTNDTANTQVDKRHEAEILAKEASGQDTLLQDQLSLSQPEDQLTLHHLKSDESFRDVIEDYHEYKNADSLYSCSPDTTISSAEKCENRLDVGFESFELPEHQRGPVNRFLKNIGRTVHKARSTFSRSRPTYY